MVSAFATANGVVIGQLKTNAKSNEITAIPALLKLLDIKECLILRGALHPPFWRAQDFVYLEARGRNHVAGAVGAKCYQHDAVGKAK